MRIASPPITNSCYYGVDTPEKEKLLGKEEAEAILDALQADESNLRPRKYKAVRRIKLEKDW